MSIVCDEDEKVIKLVGLCTVEESEDLLQEIDERGWSVEVSELTHLHTACLQVLLLRNVLCRGASRSERLQQLLENSLSFEQEN